MARTNLRFGRFGYQTGQITGLNTYYIDYLSRFLRLVFRPHYLANWQKQTCDHQPVYHHHDHDAIICSMTTDLRVQIKMFTSRAWAAKTLLIM